MKKVFVLSATVLLATTSSAMAAITNYETRAVDVAVDNSDYKASWAAQNSAITVNALADFNGAQIPDGVDSGFSHLTVSFNTSTAGSQWGFKLAPDAGLGGAIYLDGNLLSKNTSDLWWGGDWNNTLALLQANDIAVTTGNHVFEGYWAEACCNGAQGLQYTNDGQSWRSMADLASPVPVPAALWLFSSALLGVVGISKRRK